MNILVRNLPRTTTEAELREMFAPFGRIASLNIVTDPGTGTSKGFGFVEMPDIKEAKSAVYRLNGKKISGNSIRVKSTRQKQT